MKNFNWTFPIVVGILGLLIGQIYLAQETSVHWTVLILTSFVISLVSALAANQGIPHPGKFSVGGGEGQGPWYSRFLLVFIIMLVVASGVAVLGYDQR